MRLNIRVNLFFHFRVSLALISGRLPVPSENFVPRYKENGRNAAFLTADG